MAARRQLPDVRVDLKFAVWSADMDHWREFAPAALAVIEGLTVGTQVRIVTAPRKEIRFGDLILERRGAKLWAATGQFWNTYDEDTEDRLSFELRASSLWSLFAKVDKVEDQLIQLQEAK